MEYSQALSVANRFMELLRPVSERIEIVGSVKRNDKPDVHDIEILLIPKPGRPRPNFGDKVIYNSHLDKVLAELLDSRLLMQPLKKANGEKYKKFAITEFSEVNDFCLDLFIVNELTWGVQNVIRTGPRIFSHCFVTNQGMVAFDKESGRKYKGLLPAQYRYIRGETKIMCGEDVLSLPEESDAIALLGHGWIEPAKRRQYIQPF